MLSTSISHHAWYPLLRHDYWECSQHFCFSPCCCFVDISAIATKALNNHERCMHMKNARFKFLEFGPMYSKSIIPARIARQKWQQVPLFFQLVGGFVPSVVCRPLWDSTSMPPQFPTRITLVAPEIFAWPASPFAPMMHTWAPVWLAPTCLFLEIWVLWSLCYLSCSW